MTDRGPWWAKALATLGCVLIIAAFAVWFIFYLKGTFQ